MIVFNSRENTRLGLRIKPDTLQMIMNVLSVGKKEFKERNGLYRNLEKNLNCKIKRAESILSTEKKHYSSFSPILFTGNF